MKTLQDNGEQIWQISANCELRTIERKPEKPESIILLLHGLDERGLRIYRKLLRFLPTNSYVIAPNGPYPLPRMKTDRMDFGYAWYFYNRFTQSYPFDQTLAVNLLRGLLEKANPDSLPVHIIGFSQGGYLAPLVANAIQQTKLVIGIGCEFKSKFFHSHPHYSLLAIHGDQDTIISPEHATEEISKLDKKGIKVEWHLIPELKHEINQQVALKIKQAVETYGK